MFNVYKNDLRLTLIISFRKGELIMCGEISEGDTKLLYVMKLVPPKDLGFLETIIWCSYSVVPL